MTSPFNDAHDTSISDAERIVLVNGRCFSITDRDGLIRRSTDGVVFEDVRVLSRMIVTISNDEVGDLRQRLATSEPTPFQSAIVTRPHPDFTEGVPTETYIHRQCVGRGARHDIEIHNAGDHTITRTVRAAVDTDFAHIFDMKSGTGSSRTSTLEWDGRSGSLVDPDDAATSVKVTVAPAPTGVIADDKTIAWRIECPARSTATVSIGFEPAWDDQPAGLLFPVGAAPARVAPAHRDAEWHRAIPRVVTTDRRLSGAVEMALADLASLRIFDPNHADRTVVAAGAPWFMTLFGRDSLLTSWMVLPFAPELATGVLFALAELQGTAHNPESEEAPGKIIHELRRRGGTDAFADRGRYYGTVDATPLFVMVAGEAHRWGHLAGDDLKTLWPHVNRAIEWIVSSIDSDPAGFLRYERSTSSGLINQGWKDSWDGVTFADGRIPTGAIALSEVQGYAYGALLAAVELAQTIDAELDTDGLNERASRLRERFDEEFWNEMSSSYALGIAADGSQIDSVTTNPGHAVWTGITDPDRAGRYLDRIMDDDLWSGWGLRTLSPDAAAYNPLSYHNGSVWPHDTSLVTAGAARLGRFDIVDTLVSAALDAATHKEGRPPELFAGISRSTINTPVDYPDSCSPQAWASASTLLNLRSQLGFDPPERIGDVPTSSRPNGEASQRIRMVEGLRIGSSRIDAVVENGAISFCLSHSDGLKDETTGHPSADV